MNIFFTFIGQLWRRIWKKSVERTSQM